MAPMSQPTRHIPGSMATIRMYYSLKNKANLPLVRSTPLLSVQSECLSVDQHHFQFYFVVHMTQTYMWVCI